MRFGGAAERAVLWRRGDGKQSESSRRCRCRRGDGDGNWLWWHSAAWQWSVVDGVTLTVTMAEARQYVPSLVVKAGFAAAAEGCHGEVPC